jgi:hypothetical protein
VGRWILIDVGAAALFALTWYGWFVRYNRRRAASVLQWIQAASLGKGRVTNLEWQGHSSRVRANLRFATRWFEDVCVTVRLFPRPLPLKWSLSRWRKQQETLTFEADMGFPPGFHLDIIRHRWSGQTGNKKKANSKWAVTRPGPIVLTTKEEWPFELTAIVNALATCREKDFVTVRFHPNSPHFAATVTLDSLANQQSASALLGLFRELAASSSAKQQHWD